MRCRSRRVLEQILSEGYLEKLGGDSWRNII